VAEKGLYRQCYDRVLSISRWLGKNSELVIKKLSLYENTLQVDFFFFHLQPISYWIELLKKTIYFTIFKMDKWPFSFAHKNQSPIKLDFKIIRDSATATKTYVRRVHFLSSTFLMRVKIQCGVVGLGFPKSTPATKPDPTIDSLPIYGLLGVVGVVLEVKEKSKKKNIFVSSICFLLKSTPTTPFWYKTH